MHEDCRRARRAGRRSPLPATAEVRVRVAGGTVDLTATAAPLAEVLDRLARQTGMKVVYEGAAPRQLVTVSLHGRTPAETVLAVLEGLGVNFALVADPTRRPRPDPGGRRDRVGLGAVLRPPRGRARPSAPATRAGPSARRPGRARRPSSPPSRRRDEEPEADEAGLRRLPPGAEITDPRGVPDAPPDPTARQPRRPGPAPSRRRAPACPHAPRAEPSPPRRSCRSRSPSRRRRPGPRGARRSLRPRPRTHARQPAAAVGGARGYGRRRRAGEGGRGVGKALPGRGTAGPDGPADDPRLAGQEDPLVVARPPVEDAQALVGAGARDPWNAAERRPGLRERPTAGSSSWSWSWSSCPRPSPGCREAPGPTASPGR